MLSGMEIIVVTVAVISLGFGVIMDVVTGIGVEVLADANVNVFASMMTALEFAVPKPREGFNC